jgi:hypothetical protein
MVFYRYAGMNDGSFNWAVEQKVIGSGWQSFSHVFAGDNGAIYAIKPDGQMLFYRYAGMHDGSFNWAVEQKVIGSGWQGFSQVFAGDNGAIYGIKPDGQMVFYRYAGMNDGAFNWAVEQKAIGSGWSFSQIAVGGSAATGPAPAPAPAPSRPTPLPVFSNQRCLEYATKAVADFKNANRFPACVKMIRQQNPGRWNDQLPGHYNWCVTAQRVWISSEMDARDKLLLACGGASLL